VRLRNAPAAGIECENDAGMRGTADFAPERSRSWPADQGTIEAAQQFLQGCNGRRVVVACDSDVDGLTSAVIIERALASLGSEVSVLPVRRGEHVHSPAMRERILAQDPQRLVVLDMGSRPEAVFPRIPTLIVDHHDATKGLPPGALVVNGFDRKPVAPTSVLAFVVAEVVPGPRETGWLAALGAVADLGSAAPFAKLLDTRISVTQARKAASLLNAARRAPDPDPLVALETLRAAKGLAEVTSGRLPLARRLEEMLVAVRSEVERCSRVPPRITGNVALIQFTSGAQVHPLVATRWSTRLRPRIVVAANDGYLPGRTNFAIRCADEVDLLAWLRRLPFRPVDPAEYANGHARATGGSLSAADFQRFAKLLGFGAVELDS
jgi:hypothetical protein